MLSTSRLVRAVHVVQDPAGVRHEMPTAAIEALGRGVREALLQDSEAIE